MITLVGVVARVSGPAASSCQDSFGIIFVQSHVNLLRMFVVIISRSSSSSCKIAAGTFNYHPWNVENILNYQYLDSYLNSFYWIIFKLAEMFVVGHFFYCLSFQNDFYILHQIFPLCERMSPYGLHMVVSCSVIRPSRNVFLVARISFGSIENIFSAQAVTYITCLCFTGLVALLTVFLILLCVFADFLCVSN